MKKWIESASMPIIAAAVIILSQSLGTRAQNEQQFVIDENNFKVKYSYDDFFLNLFIETTGSPSIDVDVNQNGQIDGGFDRTYAMLSDGTTLCPQFRLTKESWTTCGVPTKASVRRMGNTYIFSIPHTELAIINNGKSYIAFRCYDGAWKNIPQAGFDDPYIFAKNVKNNQGYVLLPASVKKQGQAPGASDVFIGHVQSITDSEIVIGGKDIAGKVFMGDKLCLYAGEMKIILRATFPMQTVTKCVLVSGNRKDIKYGMKAYKIFK